MQWSENKVTVAVLMLVALALFVSPTLGAKGGGKGKPDGGGDETPPADPAILFTDTGERNGSVWDVFMMNDDGTNLSTVVDGAGDGLPSDPNWAPDGTRFVYRGKDADGDPGLFVGGVDDRTPVQIYSGWTYDPVWAPTTSSDWILFSVISSTGNDRDLWVLKLGDSTATNLTNTTGLLEDNQTWSPDADYVAARYHLLDSDGKVSEEGVVVFDIDWSTGKPVKAGETRLTITQLDGKISSPNFISESIFLDWSRSGAKIAFCSPSSTASSRLDLFILDLDPNGDDVLYGHVDGQGVEDTAYSVTQLTSTPDIEERHPSWSPDDSQIVHSQKGAGKKDLGILVRKSDGTGSPTVLRNKGEHLNRPDWRR